MAALRLSDADRYAEIDLVEDSTVDAVELQQFAARGGDIRTNGFRLTRTGRIVLGPRQGYRRGDVAAAMRRRRR